jgi:hypothetical protein
LADGLLLHGKRIFAPDTADLRTRALDLIHAVGQRAYRRCSNASVQSFTFRTTSVSSRTMYGHARRASATRPRRSSRLACCSPLRCLPRSGRTSPWTSSRGCLRSTGAR